MKKYDLFATGLMTFALFLGAGNIIFPPSLGLQAGTALLPAIAGFLFTAVGLPALILIVLGRINSSAALTQKLPSWMASTFWILLFTTIGPAFGMPRAVTVAYEMGIKPFFAQDTLLPFTIVFCLVTFLLAFKPGKLVDYIGKVMTPVMILMLAALALAAFVNPLDVPQLPSGDYASAPVVNGLIQGYMTMDAIAAVGFGWVIIRTITSKGASTPAEIAKASTQVALIYAVLMSACYLSMGYVGATSASVAADATHGGTILSNYVAATFGPYGQWLLAAIIVMACLTTTVGLTNACCEYYQQAFNAPFTFTAVVIVTLTGVVANFGLEQILATSLPAILVLCPVALALVLASLQKSAQTTLTSVVTTLLFGSIDAINILGKMPEFWDNSFHQALPLYSAHASWLVPCLFVLSASLMKRRLTPLVGHSH
ncbi:branched-chain amino acid transport system II carrier protein [Vibrio sp. CAU 1672]|uniref:branched-chain amino acid transport system II carrier protein n=1 Tax=Vibrio sp. CAU 1672 TaxID=3032594 RepID=UPI0023DAE169|nr:branched-chain amino acid transport system II carrier protein [Vibrio sp. CAU 1672]MDF2154552.1 branched-chain amino acid transport system II carrier protein [Vibrio sp. CAU 1672]